MQVGVAALVFAAIPLPGYPAAAQSELTAPLIAVIDVQRVMRDSTAVQSLQERIETLRGSYQDELRKEEEELRVANQELVRQRTVLSAEIFAQKRNDLEQRVAALQRDAQGKKRSIDQLFAGGLTQIQKSITKVASDIATARGFDLVLNGSAAILFKPEYDITEDVIKRLNETLVQVDLPSLGN
ncbi:MAG: OmpH family outer membrane protein [Kiloniellales bacterium]